MDVNNPPSPELFYHRIIRTNVHIETADKLALIFNNSLEQVIIQSD